MNFLIALHFLYYLYAIKLKVQPGRDKTLLRVKPLKARGSSRSRRVYWLVAQLLALFSGILLLRQDHEEVVTLYSFICLRPRGMLRLIDVTGG